MVASKEKRDSSGAVTGGVMVLSRWAITVETIHDAYIDQHAVVVNLERKGGPPILIAGVYLSASSHPDRKRVLLGIETLLNVKGLRDHLIIGDFNLTPDDDPVAMWLARGRFSLGNVAGGRVLVPTRKGGKRAIDLAMVSSSFDPEAAISLALDSDHLMQIFQWRNWKPRDICIKVRKRAWAPQQVDSKTFDLFWADYGVDYEDALQGGDLDAAWTTLVQALETLWIDPNARGGDSRAEKVRLVQAPPKCFKKHVGDSFLTRKVRNAEARHRQWFDRDSSNIKLEGKVKADLAWAAQHNPYAVDHHHSQPECADFWPRWLAGRERERERGQVGPLHEMEG